MASAGAIETTRQEFVLKIHLICYRIVRARHATDRKVVRFYFALRVIAIILSALGGAGLTAFAQKPDLAQQTGWALVASIISLAVGILMQIANEFGIQETAFQARLAKDAFRLVENNLESALLNSQPTDPVNKLLNEIETLMQKLDKGIPDKSAKLEDEAKKLADGFVAKYGGLWKFPETIQNTVTVEKKP